MQSFDMEPPPAVFVHSTADVSGAMIGAGTRVWHQAQVMPGVAVGTWCVLGKACFIGSGSGIGDNVKIGNGANVFGANVGDGVLIGPGACLMEDPRPRAVTPDGEPKGIDDFEHKPVEVRVGASIGGGALILPGVVVGAWAMIGAGAVVHRNVADHALVAGNPARQIASVCRCGDRLDENLQCACGRQYAEAARGLQEVAAS